MILYGKKIKHILKTIYIYMRTAALIIAVLVLACAGEVPDDDADLAEWAAWKAKYHRENRERDAGGEVARFATFRANLATVRSLSAANDAGQEQYALGPTADLTDAEYQAMLGFRADPTSAEMAGMWYPRRTALNAALPASIDYRQRGAVGPVIDQGSCGSCWACAVAAMCESVRYLYSAPNASGGRLGYLDLSVQQLLECARSYGCEGGDPAVAAAYASSRGLMADADYPYKTAVTGTCRYSEAAVRTRFAGIVRLPAGDEAALARALVERGPIAVAVDASSNAFRYYGGGIVASACGSRLNHAVLLVGYDRASWLIQNSWGTGYGVDGYVRIARNARNMCGVASYAIALNH